MDVTRSTLFMLCLGIAAANFAPLEDRQRLTHALMQNYDKVVPPSGPNGILLVNHTIVDTTIISLENNLLQVRIWNDMQWIDERLVWNSTANADVKQMNLPSTMVWIPDIHVFESVRPYGEFPNRNVNVVVESDGKVLYVPPEVLTVTCPFDESVLYSDNIVVCKVTFMSWTYPCAKLDMHPISDDLDSFLQVNRKWRLESIHAKKNEKKYECCPETYCDVTYELSLRRIA